MHIESDGGGAGSAFPSTAKMTGSIAAFGAAAAAGKVSIDPESAESMAAKIDAIAARAEERLGRFEILEQGVRLGSSPVALTMAEQDLVTAVGTPTSAKENLVLYIKALEDLAAAIRASARNTRGRDAENATRLTNIGDDLV
ncbi:hypothetical protein [Actinoalloteichus caeruleus]|uniref:PE domain-containing protein n=1 Tax=Actinoalloteichus caeruleus DSM 43889 TaxID=1120930 RepID=A0ABT1JHL3_ACTCY|nr:hypothetical protein [Actinoalloteichus caeruleus]MCP2332002.1 hypothetical protein [Actinoalloteichus caeruleus DSM 43889]